MTTFNYAAYGLHFGADRKISFAVPGVEDRPPDIRLDLSACAYVDDPEKPVAPRSGFRLVDDGTVAHLWFTGSGRLDFLINAAADHVSISGHQTNRNEMSLLLLGQVCGTLLRMRGIPSLHACALNHDGAAFAVLGASGAGKSTLAAFLANSGLPVLADDVTALSHNADGWIVQPGFPAMKFWPDTLEFCGVKLSTHNRVFNFTDKRVVLLGTETQPSHWQFQTTPLPLRGIFVLQARREDVQKTQVKRLPPLAAIPALMANRASVMSNLGTQKDTAELKDFAKLASAVPVWSVTCPENIHHLPNTAEMLRECLTAGKMT